MNAADSSILAGQQNAVALFHRAVSNVSAYAHFLKERRFEPASVETYADFQNVPLTSKENYIDKYAINELVWNGSLGGAALVHSSSGTSGNPYYWPCSEKELLESMDFYESVFRNSFEVGGRYKSTLLVVCFGMGTWIAGSYTTAASMLLRLKGLPITIVTPGFNRQEALRLMKDLGSCFDQVILAGIPSFMKDLLDEWSQTGSSSSLKVRVLLAGEGFPERWRQHVARSIGGDVFDVISLLGSADAGLIGFESSHSIEFRKAIEEDEHLRKTLINNDRVPGFLHFDPSHRFLESSIDGQLLITADRAIPLIRYDTMDVGGVLSRNLLEQMQLNQNRDKSKTELPLVYLFGRGSKSATIYGANIYAELIQEFLVESSVQACTSGRFQIETIWLTNSDQQLSVRIELADNCTAMVDEPASWSKSLAKLLCSRSTEYSRIFEEYGARALPVVTLHNYGSTEYFPSTQKKCS